MLWLAVLGQAGRGNRETLYNTVLLIEIIWHCLKSLHYFEDRQKAGEKCCAPSVSLLCQLFLQRFSFFIFFAFIPGAFFSVISGVALIAESDIFAWVVVTDLTSLLSHCRKWPDFGSCIWPIIFLSPSFLQNPDLPPCSSSLSPLCSQTAEEPAAEWLDGTGPFRTHLRPLTKTTQEEETIIESERTHLNHPQHFSRWQPTGSTNCVTWPSSPVPCTRSPLTPCGATPPLTYWPVATSLAGLGQIFPKRWLHCVSNTKQQLTNNKQLWILAYIYTYIFNQLKAKIHIPSPTTLF